MKNDISKFEREVLDAYSNL